MPTHCAGDVVVPKYPAGSGVQSLPGGALIISCRTIISGKGCAGTYRTDIAGFSLDDDRLRADDAGNPAAIVGTPGDRIHHGFDFDLDGLPFDFPGAVHADSPRAESTAVIPASRPLQHSADASEGSGLELAPPSLRKSPGPPPGFAPKVRENTHI